VVVAPKLTAVPSSAAAAITTLVSGERLMVRFMAFPFPEFAGKALGRISVANRYLLE
jgi:hypothetical protein